MAEAWRVRRARRRSQGQGIAEVAEVGLRAAAAIFTEATVLGKLNILVVP